MATKIVVGPGPFGECPTRRVIAARCGTRERTGKFSQIVPIAEPQQQEWQRKAPLFWIFRSPEAGRVKKLREDTLGVVTKLR